MKRNTTLLRENTLSSELEELSIFKTKTNPEGSADDYDKCSVSNSSS